MYVRASLLFAALRVCLAQNGGLPDLIIETEPIITSARIQRITLGQIQCAIDEGCGGYGVKEIIQQNPDTWTSMERVLLRFTTSSTNIGDVNLVVNGTREDWEFHRCHNHYHSISEYGYFDILQNNEVVAGGSKRSFCLEDTICLNGVQKNFICGLTEKQGISVGCTDIYRWDLDCQWVDVTDLSPGDYVLRVIVNPARLYPEKTFENNAALCDFTYENDSVVVHACTLTEPNV